MAFSQVALETEPVARHVTEERLRAVGVGAVTRRLVRPGRPLTGALASGRAPPSPALIFRRADRHR